MFAQRGRTEARKVVFIFINGKSAGFPASEATDVMATARQAGLEIYVIGEEAEVYPRCTVATISSALDHNI